VVATVNRAIFGSIVDPRHNRFAVFRGKRLQDFAATDGNQKEQTSTGTANGFSSS
jgi:hypothetical protein